jgi:hypothetical protein
MLVFSKNSVIAKPLTLDNSFRIVQIKRFLKNKYQLFDGDTLVHESILYKYTRMSIFAGYFCTKVVGNCYTNPKYRGQGIYGYIINYISKEQGKVILFVDEKNKSSQKGLLKIDCSVIDKFTYKKLWWFYLIRRN